MNNNLTNHKSDYLEDDLYTFKQKFNLNTELSKICVEFFCGVVCLKITF